MTLAVTEPVPKSASAARPKWDSPLTLRDLLTPVFLFLKPALIAFAIPVALAFAVALVAQPTFTAQSRLLVLLGPEYVFRGDPANAGANVSFDRAQIMHAETEILASQSLRAAALKAVGVGRVYKNTPNTPQGMEEALRELDQDLGVDNIPQSNIIDLTFRNRDPKVAAEFLNVLIKLYLERRRDIFQQADVPAVRAQRAELTDRLFALEKDIAAIANRHHFADLDQELSAAQAQKASLDSQSQAIDQQLATRQGRVALLDRKIEAAPGELQLSTDQTRSQQIDALTTNLLALQAQRREAAAKYNDGFPLIADLDARIAELQAQIAATPKQQLSTVRRGLNPLRQQLDGALADAQSDVAGLTRGRTEVQAARKAINARLAELIAIGPQYRDLVRRRGVLEAAILDLDKRAQEAELAGQLTPAQANVRVVQPAEPPLKGKTGRLKMLAAGVVLGLIAAACLIVVRTALDQTMATPRDLEQKLGVPTLLSIAKQDVGDPPVVNGLPRPRYLRYDGAETLMRLLYANAAKKGGRVLQMTAAGAGEGVSSLLLDLAVINAARSAAKILVLDVEPVEGGGVANRLRQMAAAPLTTISAKISKLEGHELYVSAPIGSKSLTVVDSAWDQVIARARTQFDLILIDAPPSHRSNVAVTLAPLVDMTLLVVEAEATRAGPVRSLIEAIEGAEAEVIGAILNKRQFHIPAWLYARL